MAVLFLFPNFMAREINGLKCYAPDLIKKRSFDGHSREMVSQHQEKSQSHEH